MERKFRRFFKDKMSSEYERGSESQRIKCSSPIYEVLLLVPLILTSLIFIGCLTNPVRLNFFIYLPTFSCVTLFFALILIIKIMISKNEPTSVSFIIKLKNAHCSFYGYHLYLFFLSTCLYGIAISVDTSCKNISRPNLLPQMFLVTIIFFSLNFSRSLAWVKSLLAIIAVTIFTFWSFFDADSNQISDDDAMPSIYGRHPYLFWVLYITNYIIVIIFIQFINYDNQVRLSLANFLCRLKFQTSSGAIIIFPHLRQTCVAPWTTEND